MSHDVIGAVLAGGLGRRIGGDKPSLEVGDRTLVRHAVDALRAAGLEVALVLRPQQPVPLTAQTAAMLRDAVEDAGPLGGLHALLRWLPVEWALVAPCDQPFLAPRLLRGLLTQQRAGFDAIVTRPDTRLEPLPGLYRRSCLPSVEAALARGERSLRDLLAHLRVSTVPARSVRRWDPELHSFVNVNTPAELELARTIAAPAVDSEQRSTRPIGHRR